MEPLIKIKGLSYSYPQNNAAERSLALKELDLAIMPGEYLVILGPNGSGKSTLAKMLNGLLVPSRGEVRVAGLDTRELEQLWQVRSMVGMVFQNPDNQLLAATVEDDLAFGPENLGVKPQVIQERVEALLTDLQLTELRSLPPHLLSGGQKQKVAMAGALAMQPRCLVLDEATSMLDPQGRQLVLATVAQLHREQEVSIVQITHQLEEALSADKVLVLANGGTAAYGTPAEVFSQQALLASLGLEVPAAVELSNYLKQSGVSLPPLPTSEQLITGLLDYLPIQDNTTVEVQESVDKSVEQPVEALAQPKPAMVELAQVSFTYAPGMPWEQKALRDLSLTIRQGELIGLAGHTGSGKSTLLELLNGMLHPSAGRMLFQGKDSCRGKKKRVDLRGQVGLVWQFPEDQLFAATVLEEVAFGPSNLGWPPAKIEQAVQEALQAVGLNYAQYTRVSPFALSYGQKRRVALASILAMQPSLLVLDEPFVGLDPQGRRELLELLQTLNRRNELTIVIASHDLEYLASCCTRLLVLNAGSIELDGPPVQVFLQQKQLDAMGLAVPFGVKLKRAIEEAGLTSLVGRLFGNDGIVSWEQLWPALQNLGDGRERV